LLRKRTAKKTKTPTKPCKPQKQNKPKNHPKHKNNHKTPPTQPNQPPKNATFLQKNLPEIQQKFKQTIHQTQINNTNQPVSNPNRAIAAATIAILIAVFAPRLKAKINNSLIKLTQCFDMKIRGKPSPAFGKRTQVLLFHLPVYASMPKL
jgi:hypothetical protein